MDVRIGGWNGQLVFAAQGVSLERRSGSLKMMGTNIQDLMVAASRMPGKSAFRA
jgi:hypothetical protein